MSNRISNNIQIDDNGTMKLVDVKELTDVEGLLVPKRLVDIEKPILTDVKKPIVIYYKHQY